MPHPPVGPRHRHPRPPSRDDRQPSTAGTPQPDDPGAQAERPPRRAREPERRRRHPEAGGHAGPRHPEDPARRRLIAAAGRDRRIGRHDASSRRARAAVTSPTVTSSRHRAAARQRLRHRQRQSAKRDTATSPGGPGSVAPRIGRTVEADHRRPQRRGQVQRSGVARHHHRRGPENGGQIGHAGGRGQPRGPVRTVDHARGQGLVAGTPRHQRRQPARRSAAIRRPDPAAPGASACSATRRRVEDRERPLSHPGKPAHGVEGGRTPAPPAETAGRRSRAQSHREGQVLFGDVRRVPRIAGLGVEEPGRRLAQVRRGKAQHPGRPARPGDRRGLQEPARPAATGNGARCAGRRPAPGPAPPGTVRRRPSRCARPETARGAPPPPATRARCRRGRRDGR